MKSRSQVYSKAESLSVEVRHHATGLTWDTDLYCSKKGLRFASTECHSAVVNEFRSGQAKGEHWQDVYSELVLEECTDPNCEICQ